MRSAHLLLAAALCATFTAAAAPDPGPAAFIKRLQAGEKLTIVTMGTSLTGGQWRWPEVMTSDWLDKDFPGQVTLFNEGVSASSSSVGPGKNNALSGLGKLPAVLAHQPDVVFIEFTTNDAYLPYDISVDDSKRNVGTMIDQILAANPKTEIILQTMNAVKDNPSAGPNNLHANARPRLADYAEGYRQIAKTRGLRLVDHYPQWLKLMQENPAQFDQLVPDRIHPRAAGYRTVLLPELKRALMPPPVRPVIYLQNPSAQGMTVCLLAPTASANEVRVVLAAEPPTEMPAQATAIPDTAWTIWKLRLDHLRPGTSYQYLVRWRNGDQSESSPPLGFRTLDPSAERLRAVAFNDTHMSAKVAASLLARVKPDEFEMTLLLGDILEGGRKDGSDVLASWSRYVEVLDGANKPIVYVRGNHDTRGAFAKRLAYLFDLPNLDSTKPWGEEQWQYSFQAGPVHFMVLDTGEDDDDSTPLESYKNPALWQQVRQRQTEWLKPAITAPNPAPWRVLLCHIPLYNSPWCSARARTLWTPTLKEWNPDLELSGHDHQWRPAQPLPAGVPWPTLVGGGPAMGGGEEGTMMVLSADAATLRVRLIGARDGRQLSEFVSERPN